MDVIKKYGIVSVGRTGFVNVKQNSTFTLYMY
jgi:hypothetical protein